MLYSFLDITKKIEKTENEIMVKVIVCISSSCQLKGSRQVVEELQEIINSNGMQDKVELAGAFCMGECGGEGISAKVNEKFYSIKPNAVGEFFDNIIATAVTA